MQNDDDEMNHKFTAIAVAEIVRGFIKNTDPERLDLTASEKFTAGFLQREQEALASLSPELREHFEREMIAYTQTAIVVGREFEAYRLAEDNPLS